MKIIIKSALYLFMSSMVFTCGNTKRDIAINQSEATDYPVIIGTYKDDLAKNYIGYIRIPNKIEIKNTSYVNQYLNKIYYYCNSSFVRRKDAYLQLYTIGKDSLIPTSNYKRRIVRGKERLDYLYYVSHHLDTVKTIQHHFKPYLKQMILEDKDTLHIGSFSQFKKKHQVLLNQLTENDTISVRFQTGHSKKTYKQKVVIPGTSEVIEKEYSRPYFKSIHFPAKW